MPVLVLTIPENLNELLQNRSLASVAALGEFGRIMIVAVDHAVVLVIAISSPKRRRTDRAGKMVNVVFPVKSGHIRST